jgi:hypothetical protein
MFPKPPEILSPSFNWLVSYPTLPDHEIKNKIKKISDCWGGLGVAIWWPNHPKCMVVLLRSGGSRVHTQITPMALGWFSHPSNQSMVAEPFQSAQRWFGHPQSYGIVRALAADTQLFSLNLENKITFCFSIKKI